MDKDKKIKAICLGIFIGVIFMLVATCILLTTATVPRTTKAQKYDLDCLTTINKNPLMECKER